MVTKKFVIRNSEAKGLVQSQGRHGDQERQGNLHKHRSGLYQLSNRQVGIKQQQRTVVASVQDKSGPEF